MIWKCRFGSQIQYQGHMYLKQWEVYRKWGNIHADRIQQKKWRNWLHVTRVNVSDTEQEHEPDTGHRWPKSLPPNPVVLVLVPNPKAEAVDVGLANKPPLVPNPIDGVVAVPKPVGLAAPNNPPC